MGTRSAITESATANASSAPAVLGERRSSSASWGPKRRGSRLTLDIPVEVYGLARDGRIFREETRTRVVSAHGALISLAAEVALEQMIVVVCKRNREEMHCRVVNQSVENGEAHIGVAFEISSPKFWGVSFPD